MYVYIFTYVHKADNKRLRKPKCESSQMQTTYFV